MNRRTLAIGSALALSLALGSALWVCRDRPPGRLPPSSLRFEQTETPEAAVAFYEQRLKLNPNSALDRATLGRLFLQLARASGDDTWYERAEKIAGESLKLLPSYNAGAHLVLGQAFQARHAFKEAIEEARKALEAKPTSNEALQLQVTSYLGLGDLEKAHELADQLITRQPGAEARVMRGLVLAARGRESEAEFEFAAALADPEPGSARAAAWIRSTVARNYLRVGRYRAARTLLEEALQLVPAYPAALGYLAQLELQSGNLQEAEKRFEEAYKASNDAGFLVGAAASRRFRGDRAGAVETAKRAEKSLKAEVDRGSPYAHRLVLARLWIERAEGEDLATAITLLEREVQGRRNVETLELMAWASFLAGRIEPARSFMREALRTGIESPLLWARAARIEEAAGDPAAARFYADSARKLDATSIEVEQTLSAIRPD